MAYEELIKRYEAGGGRLAKARAEGLAVPPSLQTVVLTCMDSRINTYTLFGLNLGEVHVLRNAGGVVTDDDFSEELAREIGMRPPWRTHAFRDPATSVRRDMAQLRHDPFLHPDTRVRGFVLDIESFDLEEIFVDD